MAFWIGAAVLSAGALGFVVMPLWQSRKRTGAWSWLGVTAGAAIAGGSASASVSLP